MPVPWLFSLSLSCHWPRLLLPRNCHTPIPPFPQLSHSHSLNCHTPIPSTVTLPFPQLSHSHFLNCHTPIPSTVTLPFPKLSHSHSLNCHTPIPSTVTLPFPQLSHSHSLKTSHVQYITGPTLIRVSLLSFKHHNHTTTPHRYTPTSCTVTHPFPLLTTPSPITPHPYHCTWWWNQMIQWRWFCHHTAGTSPSQCDPAALWCSWETCGPRSVVSEGVRR